MIPYAFDPWNLVAEQLYIGGHDYLADIGVQDVVVHDEFNAVWTLCAACTRRGPDRDIPHRVIDLPDAELLPTELRIVRSVVDEVAAQVVAGKRVLVRCHAGYNRSGLIVGLVLQRLGYTGVIELIRSKRSKYALHNSHFVELLEAGEVDGIER